MIKPNMDNYFDTFFKHSYSKSGCYINQNNVSAKYMNVWVLLRHISFLGCHYGKH